MSATELKMNGDQRPNGRAKSTKYVLLDNVLRWERDV